MIINVPYHTVCYHFDLFSMLNLKLDPFLQILYTKTQILHLKTQFLYTKTTVLLSNFRIRKSWFKYSCIFFTCMGGHIWTHEHS